MFVQVEPLSVEICHWIVGAGAPLAPSWKTALWPAVIAWSVGGVLITGAVDDAFTTGAKSTPQNAVFAAAVASTMIVEFAPALSTILMSWFALLPVPEVDVVA